MQDFSMLVQTLEDEDTDKVVSAAHALGDLGDLRAVPILIDLLERTDNSKVRDAVAVGLRELGNDAALLPLVRQIKNPSNANRSGTLAWALGTLDCRPAIVELAQIMCEGNYEVKMMIAMVFESLDGPLDPVAKSEAVKVLQACLAKNTWKPELKKIIDAAIDILTESPTHP